MPFLTASVLRTNELFSGLESFAPDRLLGDIGEATTLTAVGENLGVFAVMPDAHAEALKQFLGDVPAALDAAIVAGVRSALSRGLRTQLTWQPGYDFELRIWEVSDGSEGLVNFHMVTPHPDESGLS